MVPISPTAARPKTNRLWLVLGSAVLIILVYGIVSHYWGEKRSYGPAEAEKLDLIVAPDVSVEILPSAKSLARSRFEAFDVSSNGAVIVSTGSRVVDMDSGEDLFTSGESVRSFAFVGEALAVINAGGQLGYYEDGRLHLVGEPPVLGARLAASSDRTRLFFCRGTYDADGEMPALVSMREGSTPEVLTGYYSAIKTVGGDSFRTLFSDRNALFQVITPGRPSLVLMLPDLAQTITGIVVGGTAVYFATERAVYALDDGIAVPLVIGLGGDLRVVGEALYVLEPKQGRVYRIVISKVSKL